MAVRDKLLIIGISGSLTLAAAATCLVVLPLGSAAAAPAPTHSSVPASPIATLTTSPALMTSPALTAAPSPTATLEATLEATFSPSPSPTPRPTLLSETRVGLGTEPMVSISPYDSSLVAVVAQNITWTTPICGMPDVSISRDGGATWTEAKRPWGTRCQDIHAVIAWGPGPDGVSSRLWAANAVGTSGGLALSVTYSDNLGASWAPLYVQDFTNRWVGCFPMIAVDNSRASPNFGVVYVSYNWLPTPAATSMSVLATRDGATWVHADVPPVPSSAPYAWQFGERLATGRDGSVFLSFYQADLRVLNDKNLFTQNTPGNIVRAGYATARVRFGAQLTAEPATWAIDLVPTDRPAFNPETQSSLAVDDGGELWLAVNDKAATGSIHLGVSDDGGATWSWRIEGVTPDDSYKPSLAVSGDVVFLGWHAMDRYGAVRTYYTFSYDDGVTFQPPHRIDMTTFRLPQDFNDVGLRENADFRDGRVVYAWGDARSGSAVYVAVIKP